MRLLLYGADPVDVVREALVDAPGLDAAFVFGSVARGTAEPDSDLDLFLVGTREEQKRATRLLGEAGYFISRPVDVIGRESEQFTRAEESFLQRIHAVPKIWVHESDETLTRAA